MPNFCCILYLTRRSGHKHLRPKSIHDNEILDEFSKDYMYLACIQFINSVSPPSLSSINPYSPPPQVKTASLRWHSPMLDDISAVRIPLSATHSL